MSRKCIVEKYLHKARLTGYKTIRVPCEDLAMMCHLALDSLQASQWIPISEPPLKEDLYLVITGGYRSTAVWDGNKFWRAGCPIDVTHWMLLQEKPQQGE